MGEGLNVVREIALHYKSPFLRSKGLIVLQYSHPFVYGLPSDVLAEGLCDSVGAIRGGWDDDTGPFWLMKFARIMLRIVRISRGETLLSTSMSRKDPLGIEPPSIWSMPLLPREKPPLGWGTGSNGFGCEADPGCRNPLGSMVNLALSSENIPSFVGTLKPRTLFLAMVLALLPSSSH